MLSVATVLVGTGLWRTGIAPRTPSLLVAVGPLAGIASFWAVTLLAGLDTNGIAPFAEDTGAFTAAGALPTVPGIVLFAAGLAGLGHWMRRETPVEGLDAVSA